MILRVLLDGDSYGYEISKRIREISGESYVMKETTLYSAFSRMEKNDWTTSYPGAETGGRQRTYYSLTDTGRDYYREKCREWHETKELIGKFIV